MITDIQDVKGGLSTWSDEVVALLVPSEAEEKEFLDPGKAMDYVQKCIIPSTEPDT